MQTVFADQGARTGVACQQLELREGVPGAEQPHGRDLICNHEVDAGGVGRLAQQIHPPCTAVKFSPPDTKPDKAWILRISVAACHKQRCNPTCHPCCKG